MFFYFSRRNKIKAAAATDQSKENRGVNLSQYNLQDILEPLAKASAGTARTQYLSISRYVAGQPSGIRKESINPGLLPINNRKGSGLFSKHSGEYRF